MRGWHFREGYHDYDIEDPGVIVYPRLVAADHHEAFPEEVHHSVYRNNLFASLGAALEAVYPVSARLLGQGFFRQLARAYIVKHPSTSGNLHAFGAHLPLWIDAAATTLGFAGTYLVAARPPASPKLDEAKLIRAKIKTGRGLMVEGAR